MCDPVLIAAILEELGYLDESKGKEQKKEIGDKECKNDRLQECGEEEQKQK